MMKPTVSDVYQFWSPMHSATTQYAIAMDGGTPIYPDKYNDDGATYNDFVLV